MPLSLQRSTPAVRQKGHFVFTTHGIDDIRTRRAIENLPVLRGYTETRHKAKSWDRERRTVARIEATMLGLDIRFVVTSLDVGSAEWSTTACIARAAKPRI